MVISSSKYTFDHHIYSLFPKRMTFNKSRRTGGKGKKKTSIYFKEYDIQWFGKKLGTNL